MPSTTDGEVDESFVPLCAYSVPERALVKVPAARLRSSPRRTTVALVVLPGGEFVGEQVAVTKAGRRAMLEAEPSYKEPLPRHPLRRAGNYYAFHGFGVHHYYHWSHDLIMGARGIADLLPSDTQIIVPDPLLPFQIETLELLGLDGHLQVPFGQGQCWELENLYVVTPKLKTQLDSPEPFRWFRDAAMAYYGIDQVTPSRRLHLSRRGDGHWRTTNEPDVEAVLKGYGFETVMPGRMTFREQVELFGQAEAIVGTGAGLFNMVFSPPRTKVLQFQEASHIVHALWTAAAAMEFEYHYMVGDTVANPDALDADIHVPLDALESALEAMGLVAGSA